MKSFYIALLIVGVCNSLSYQDKNSHKTNNGTREMKNMYLTKQTDRPDQTRDELSLSGQPSSSYQYRGNDDDHLHQIVLSSLNSKIPDPSDKRVGGSNSQVSDNSNRFSQTNSPVVFQNQNPIRSNGFKPSQFVEYRNTANSKYNSRTTATRGQQQTTNLNQQRARYTVAERRSGDDTQGENNYVDDNQYDNYGAPRPDYEAPEPEYGAPETREALQHDSYFPVSGPGPGGFVGPAVFDPFPPPPPALKGSIDYILIPLILIGIAGPIFVVLYVILGAFEAKLSPITSRSIGESYKPYIESVMTTVNRALENTECLDYAACQVGSLCNQMGFTGDQLLTKYVHPITPQKYRRQMRKLISSMKENQECSIQKCLNFQ